LEISVLQDLHTWFDKYVKSFYTADNEIHPNILLKERHSHIVADHCKNLAMSLGMSAADSRLAEAVGLCHDVGRFKQFTLFRTFRDKNSINHGLFGIEQLKTEKIDRQIGPQEWKPLAFAVACHNAVGIPQHPDQRLTVYAKIVRDADKLDIYRVLPPRPADDGYSPELVSDLLAGKLLDYEKLKTYADYNLIMLSWLYDINFPWTLQQIVDQDYFPCLFETLPPSPMFSRLQKQLREQLALRLGLSQPLNTTNDALALKIHH